MIFLTVFSVFLSADGLRDALDPRICFLAMPGAQLIRPPLKATLAQSQFHRHWSPLGDE